MQHDIPQASKARQRQVLLAALKQGPVSTIEARDELNVYHAPARVLDLRKAGHRITTQMHTRLDREGRPHKVGVYTLGAGA